MLEDKLLAWRDLERAATDAAVQLAREVQGAASPGSAATALRSKQLRDAADRLFSEIVQTMRAAGRPGG